MRIEKRTSIQAYSGSVKEIIDALQNSGLPDKARLTSIDTECTEITYDFDGFARLQANTTLNFSWVDNEETTQKEK